MFGGSGDRRRAIRSAALATVAAGAVLAAPATALGADAYVSPNGSGTACTSAQPCALSTQADDNVGPGETIFMRPGTYNLTGITNLTEANPAGITLRPDPANPPGPKPLLRSTNGGSLGLSGVHARNISFDISGISGGSAALTLAGGSPSATGVDVIARGSANARGVTLNAGDLVDSTVWIPSDSGRAIGGIAGQLFNVTAIASGSNSTGLAVAAFNDGSKVFVQNSILSGTLTDASSTDTQAGGTGPYLSLGYSNFDDTDATAPATVDTATVGNNQSGAPAFTSVATGDFHQLASSPTVGAANDAVVTSATDIDGQNREVPNNDPDIGADELPASVAAPSLSGFSPASPADSTTPSLLGTSDPGSRVNVYTDAACTGPTAANGIWSGLASPGFPLSVLNGSATTFYAKADLGAGLTSPCSPGLTYQELALPPGGVGECPPFTARLSCPVKPKPKPKCKKPKKRGKKATAAAKKRCKPKKKRK